MARMYSRKKGKSGSKKPAKKSSPSWMTYKPKEIEHIILKLHKEGKLTSEIGVIMRDMYGIPNVKAVTKKKISAILKEKGLAPNIPEDLMSVIKSNIAIRKHLEDNKTDQVAKRGLEIAESKIKKLVSYYKKTKVLPEDWSYDPEKIRLLIE
jgi:small subunit ribosomal protein S15